MYEGKPYHLTEQEVLAQDKRIFDWSKRDHTQLTDVIIADNRLSRYFGAIERMADKIAKEHDTTLIKVEAIPSKWEWDSNFSSVLIRCTTPEGMFCQVLSTSTITTPALILDMA